MNTAANIGNMKYVSPEIELDSQISSLNAKWAECRTPVWAE